MERKNTSQEPQKWLNEKEVSEMIGLSLSKLRQDRFRMRGIPYSKIGKSVRYKMGDVLEYMNGSRIVAA